MRQIIILSEASHTEKDKYHMILHICEIKKKKVQMNLLAKQKEIYRHRKQTYGYQRGMGEERDKLGAWD